MLTLGSVCSVIEAASVALDKNYYEIKYLSKISKPQSNFLKRNIHLSII